MQKTVIKPIITEDGLLIPIEYIKELGNTEVEFQNNTIIIRFKSPTEEKKDTNEEMIPPTGKLGLKMPFDREELYEEIVADRF